MKAYKGSECIAPFILNFRITPRPIYFSPPPERTFIYNEWEVVWASAGVEVF
jgi:hypothetical protein